MDTNNDLNFIGGFARSLRDQQTGLDPDPSGAESLCVNGCISQLEFNAANSIVTNGRIPKKKKEKERKGKRKFPPDNKK